MISRLIFKVKRRIWRELVALFRNSECYPFLYVSWWHAKFIKSDSQSVYTRYLAAFPNPGAGIGHQMANWIAGLWFAEQFDLSHAHIPFSSPTWEQLLGFGEDSVSVDALVKEQGYKKVTLPLFDEYNVRELERIRRIMASYGGKKVVFVFEQDQFYHDQFGVMEEIQNRFYSASARARDCIQYHPENFNIAIHVRRGDIVVGQETGNQNLIMRWQDTAYFKNVLVNVISNLKTSRPIKIYLFSQGAREEFSDFDGFGNIEFCLDWDAQTSFLHMVHADLLITSKSSFSYKPALLSRGIKVCPRDFWHGYPNRDDWFLADESGQLDSKTGIFDLVIQDNAKG